MLDRWLKKHFIPHEGNDHKPHFLRSETTVIVLGFILFIETAFLLQVFVIFPATDFLASILPAVLVNETNGDRSALDIPLLEINPVLQEAAQLKADDMAARGYFAHVSPDGKTPWHWLDAVGYDYVYAGENLAVNFIDSEDVVTAWMNSPTHRANILNEKFSEIGIAAARGLYEGRETTFVVQFFGKPVLAAASPVEIVTEAKEVVSIPPAATSLTEATPQVRGETTVLTKTFSKPRTITDYFLWALLALMALALVLNTFIKIRIQHPVLVANGVLVIAITSFTLFVNEIVALFQAQIL